MLIFIAPVYLRRQMLCSGVEFCIRAVGEMCGRKNFYFFQHRIGSGLLAKKNDLSVLEFIDHQKGILPTAPQYRDIAMHIRPPATGRLSKFARICPTDFSQYRGPIGAGYKTADFFRRKGIASERKTSVFRRS